MRIVMQGEPAFYVQLELRNPVTHSNWGEGRYTTYQIFIRTNDTVFTLPRSRIRRRYSEFSWLRDRLCHSHPQTRLPVLPPKTTFFTDRFSQRFIERRMDGLKKFLEGVLADRLLLSDSYLHLFLQSTLPPQAIEESLHRGRDPSDVILLEKEQSSGLGSATQSYPCLQTASQVNGNDNASDDASQKPIPILKHYGSMTSMARISSSSDLCPVCRQNSFTSPPFKGSASGSENKSPTKAVRISTSSSVAGIIIPEETSQTIAPASQSPSPPAEQTARFIIGSVDAENSPVNSPPSDVNSPPIGLDGPLSSLNSPSTPIDVKSPASDVNSPCSDVNSDAGPVPVAKELTRRKSCPVTGVVSGGNDNQGAVQASANTSHKSVVQSQSLMEISDISNSAAMTGSLPCCECSRHTRLARRVSFCDRVTVARVVRLPEEEEMLRLHALSRRLRHQAHQRGLAGVMFPSVIGAQYTGGGW